MLVLVFVAIHRSAKLNQVIHSLLVFLAEVSGMIYFCSEHHILLIMQCPADDQSVLLIRFKEPFLVQSEGSTVLLIRASIEGMGKDIIIEAYAGFEKRAGVLNAIMDEGSEFLASLSIRNSEEMAGRIGEIPKTVLEIVLPAQTWVDVRLRSPIFFIAVKPFQPTSQG
jgi:hypothetical protein